MNLSKVKEIWKPEPGSNLELMPCPFCGGTEVAYFRYKHLAGDRFGALCADCMANIDPGWAQQKSVVQARWNHRASDVPSVRDRLIGLLQGCSLDTDDDVAHVADILLKDGIK